SLLRLLTLIPFPYTTLFRSGPVVGSHLVSEHLLHNGRHVIRWSCAHRVELIALGESMRPEDADGFAVLEHVSSALHVGHLTYMRSEEHTSELQSRFDLVCRL